MNKLFLSFIFIITLTIVGCDYNRAYEHNDSIENETWDLKKTFSHEFEIPDSMQWYNMYINIRNTTDYKYSNLFLFITTTFPKGQQAKDTVECILANKEGKWFGKGNGKYKDNRIVFKPKFRFSQSGKFNLKISHGMRVQEVNGISEIGIRLEKIQ